MRRNLSICLGSLLVLISTIALCQDDYKVINVVDGGTISGTVKWSGPVPHSLDFPITKDSQVCDPDSKKTADLERALSLVRKVAWPTRSFT